MATRLLLEIHLPVSIDTFVAITKAIDSEFPNAVVGQSTRPGVTEIWTQPRNDSA